MQRIPKTLFVGWGVSVVSYYRCFLPAVALGADYVAWARRRPEHPPADRPGRAPADVRGALATTTSSSSSSRAAWPG